MSVTDQTICEVAEKLSGDMYESNFRGKKRGRFCLTREQMRRALGVERLHQSTIQRLQDEALSLGIIIIDLDDVFPCIETRVVRRYRRPSGAIFDAIFGPEVDDGCDEDWDED